MFKGARSIQEASVAKSMVDEEREFRGDADAASEVPCSLGTPGSALISPRMTTNPSKFTNESRHSLNSSSSPTTACRFPPP